MKHTKHTFESLDNSEHGYCVMCGIIDTHKTVTMSCPPWDSQGRGDIKAKRVYEVGVVQELRQIIDDLLQVESFFRPATKVAQRCRNKYYDQLNQLIQKLEDQAGG